MVKDPIRDILFWIMYMTLLRVNLKYKQTAWMKALEALRSLGGDSQLTV